MTAPVSGEKAGSSPRLLLVGWDAADWQLINPLLDAGQMPHLKRLVEGGVIGNLRSLQPMLSPILWTSIATGKRAYHHGVRGFVEPLPDRSGLRPVGTRTRRCKALWNILSQSNRTSVVCGWQASHPAEPIRGAMVSNLFAVPPLNSTPENWPVAEGSLQPPVLAQKLAELRLHPREISGEAIQQFIPRAAEMNQNDPIVRRRFTVLAQRLAEVFSVHAAATELLETQPWDFGAVYYECIDQLGHEFMPFHSPRLAEISEHDFECYREVMSETYRIHDLMLGRLLELAGPETYVLILSDHGFESGRHRPSISAEPAQWHRPQGVFVLHGPGIRADARAEGATLLDIAPTVLTLLGLPVGEDMEGKVLVQAFRELPDIKRILTWEKLSGEDGRLADAEEENPDAAKAVLGQLVALGYIAPPDEDTNRMIARAEAEADFNAAAALVEGGRAKEASKLFTVLTEKWPRETRYWLARAQAALAAEELESAARCLEALAELELERPPTLILRGLLHWRRGDFVACQAAFQAAETLAPNDPTVLTYLGRLSLRQRNWQEAERRFRQALELEPDSAEAHYGLSVALPRQDQVEAGIDHALLAVGLRYEFPEAHFQLGAVLSRLGWFERAAQAFEITLRLRPGFALAHRYLSLIYGQLGRLESARHHRLESARLVKSALPQPIPD